VHKKILDLIDSSGGPLNAPSANRKRPCMTDLPAKGAIQSEVLIPKFPVPFHFSKLIQNQDQIIGLYEGGNYYHCNVYHPAGSCIMRSNNDTSLYSFCHVCRYILIDSVDPTFHGGIDVLYDKVYSSI